MVLRVRALQGSLAPQAGRLLRLLFVRHGQVPARATSRRLLRSLTAARAVARAVVLATNRAPAGRARSIGPVSGRDAVLNALNWVRLQDQRDVDHQGPEHRSGRDAEHDPLHRIGFLVHGPPAQALCQCNRRGPRVKSNLHWGYGTVFARRTRTARPTCSAPSSRPPAARRRSRVLRVRFRARRHANGRHRPPEFASQASRTACRRAWSTAMATQCRRRDASVS